MTDFVEVRDGVPFELAEKEFRLTAQGDLFHVIEGGWASGKYPGDFIAKEWEIVPPYPTCPFNDDISPEVVAVLVKRPKRYLTALAARDFLVKHDLHEEDGPVGLRALFRSMGGIAIQPGGLSPRDAGRFPRRTARLHSRNDITLFLAEGEDEVRRRELMALTIAFRRLEWERYEEGYDHGPVDADLTDARRTHPDAHLFAALMLVPRDPAAPRSIDITTAEEIGARLLVDPATVQDAYQLWHEITHPEQPKL